jgi:hypothetical protein
VSGDHSKWKSYLPVKPVRSTTGLPVCPSESNFAKEAISIPIASRRPLPNAAFNRCPAVLLVAVSAFGPPLATTSAKIGIGTDSLRSSTWNRSASRRCSPLMRCKKERTGPLCRDCRCFATQLPLSATSAIAHNLAPQVGLEPTTLRLTARHLPVSALLIVVLHCSF